MLSWLLRFLAKGSLWRTYADPGLEKAAWMNNAKQDTLCQSCAALYSQSHIIYSSYKLS